MGLLSPASSSTTSRFLGVWPSQVLHLSESQLLPVMADTCSLSHQGGLWAQRCHLALLTGAYEHGRGRSLRGIEECGVCVTPARCSLLQQVHGVCVHSNVASTGSSLCMLLGPRVSVTRDCGLDQDVYSSQCPRSLSTAGRPVPSLVAP